MARQKTAFGLLKFFATLIFIPLSIASGQSFLALLRPICNGTFSTLSMPQIYFIGGMLAYAVIHIFLYKPITTYVFAHELTHAVWTLLFLGRVSKIKVSSNGGEVSVSKSNFLTTLAPYFFPLYTAIVIMAYFAAKFFWPDIELYYKEFLAIVGFSWSFHILLTLHILRTEQSDLQTTGVVFSEFLILLLNLQVIVALLWVAFPVKISWVGYNISIWDNVIVLYHQASGLLFRLSSWIGGLI